MPPKLSPPGHDQLEISVFGPGFGESILIHAGFGVWLAVDSCVDPHTGRSAPISYLESIGIDPAAAIDLVVASHWHADHVAGLHDLLTTAAHAKFCCSSALTSKEFLALAKIHMGSKSSIPMGPEELHQCIETISKRTSATNQIHHRWASPDKLLWQLLSNDTPPNVQAKLTSLSPSDAMYTRSIQFMVDSLAALKAGAPDARMIAGTPNDVAVALLLEISGRQVLLGSDLEDEGNPLYGWSAVMDGLTAPNQTSSVFKVAHHGSVTGHHDAVWDELLCPSPLALLTPFRHGKHRLPTPVDRARILAKTTNAYISANPEEYSKAAKINSKAANLVNKAMKNRRLAAGPVGHIRWRAPINDPQDAGTIELFDGALPLAGVQ